MEVSDDQRPRHLRRYAMGVVFRRKIALAQFIAVLLVPFLFAFAAGGASCQENIGTMVFFLSLAAIMIVPIRIFWRALE